MPTTRWAFSVEEKYYGRLDYIGSVVPDIFRDDNFSN